MFSDVAHVLKSDQESRSEPGVRSITWCVTAAPTAVTINEGDPNDQRHQDPHLPVTDPAKAKTTFSLLLGVEPYADQPYYVGFRSTARTSGWTPTATAAG